MTADLELGLEHAPVPATAGSAPYTRHLLRRTGLLYLGALALGLTPWLLDGAAGWKVLGAGLAFPGAGFVTSLSWPALWVLPVLALTALAGVAWFGAGMVVAVPVVWIGSAVAAALTLSDPRPAGLATVLVAVLVVGAACWLALARQAAAQRARRLVRNEGIEVAVAQVQAVRERSITAVGGTGSELSASQAAALRYAVDLAHQAPDDWSGFDRIDIFQPAALRYQINQLGWALAVAQSAYTPSFHGYLSTGQRALIERYLQPEVLGYWKWERLWGHLRWSADPVGRDNIMLTGYYGINLALYQGNTGDDRYREPDSLPFRVTSRRTYPHSADDVRDSLLENYARYDDGLCLYPCEPNWSYSACNFRGAATLAAFDRYDGTDHWPRLRDRFLTKLTDEFMTRDGGVVALRSTLTGLPVPFPMPDSVLPKELSPISPRLAERYWALVRNEILEKTDNGWIAKLPGTNVDFGNYTLSDMFSLGGLYGSAREMGDLEVADAMLASIEEVEPKAEGAALWFPQRSTLFNATLVMDRLLRPGGWHDAINKPVSAEALTGPVLEDVDYPAVLVLGARTDGSTLALTLAPGDSSGRGRLTVGRLAPGSAYLCSNGERLVADADGRASIEVTLTGRYELAVAPAP